MTDLKTTIIYHSNARMDFGCEGVLNIEPTLGGDYWVVSFARLITKIRKVNGNVAIDSSVFSLIQNNNPDLEFSYIAGMPYLTWRDGSNVGREQHYSDIIRSGFCEVRDGSRTFIGIRPDGGREVIMEIDEEAKEGQPAWRTEAYNPDGSCERTGTHVSVFDALTFFGM